MQRLSRLNIGNVLLVAALVTSVASVGLIAWGEIVGSGVISGCIGPSGSIRVSMTTEACRSNEVAVSWYTKAGADAAFFRAEPAGGGGLSDPNASINGGVSGLA